ncbi:MAG: 4-(cytidine 5'-diphospho)-2-C-methyl-D-erythritol kinase [Sediminibacterium sp.]|nr:4-(cytidine 5'-diphospho)-2-C-methyl-D-erythritol kinase [Sediminibacterium sp.]
MNINMVYYSGAKINLGLQILNKRSDGYHNLESFFFPLPLFDLIEVIPHSANANDFELSFSGIKLDFTEQDNIIYKTYYFFKEKFPNLKKIKVHLHKNIPIGSGLGGGSSNAVTMFQIIKKINNLEISFEEELAWLSILGSDCPFFLYNKPCYIQGRGEIITPFKIDLSNYKIILFFPNIHISTKLIFNNHIIKKNNHPLIEQISNPVAQWQDCLINDLELTTLSLVPELKSIKNFIYKQGAIYASMSGSGSCFYGIFNKSTETQFNKELFIDNLKVNVINV